MQACPCFITQVLKTLCFWTLSGTRAHPSARLTDASARGPPALPRRSCTCSAGWQVRGPGCGTRWMLSHARPLTLLLRGGPLEGAESPSKRSDLFRELLGEGLQGEWLLAPADTGASYDHLITYRNVNQFHLGSGVPPDGRDEGQSSIHVHRVQEKLWEEG